MACLDFCDLGADALSLLPQQARVDRAILRRDNRPARLCAPCGLRERRARNPQNERQVLVELTEKGHALRTKAGCLGEALLRLPVRLRSTWRLSTPRSGICAMRPARISAAGASLAISAVAPVMEMSPQTVGIV